MSTGPVERRSHGKDGAPRQRHVRTSEYAVVAYSANASADATGSLGCPLRLLGLEDLAGNVSPATVAIIEWLASPPRLFSNFAAGVICLSMFSGAYVTEIVRAGIESVPRARYEAGGSIGLSHLQTMRYVVLPQALQRVIPPPAGQFIILIKDSSLVSLISIQELTFYALEIAMSTTQVFEVWIFVGLPYFVICYCRAVAFDRIEQRGEARR